MNSAKPASPTPPPATGPEAGAAAQSLDRRDDRFYEELTRTNNDLANLHRELAGKHAELAAAQAQLRVSELRYRTLTACSPIGILESDEAGRCLYTNPRWETITGLGADQSLGDGWQQALDPRDAPGLIEEWVRGVRTGSGFSRELRLVAAGGATHWAHIRSSPIDAEAGKPPGRVSTVEDITDRKQSEAALEIAHRELLDVSRRAGMAEVATNVLHNVGNVLNSVNVSSACAADTLRKSKVASLPKLAALFREHEVDLGRFLTVDPKGRQLPAYLDQLAAHLVGEQTAVLSELADLQKSLDHIMEIVAMQQTYARVSGLPEPADVRALVEDALRLNAAALARHGVQVVSEHDEVPSVTTEKHKVLQILVNLIRNAKYACAESGLPGRQMTVHVANGGHQVLISVRDNGVGIPPGNCGRIFTQGFTTRKTGHGFGLHQSALAAREIGGSLTFQSDGRPGQGAVFTLSLPVHP